MPCLRYVLENDNYLEMLRDRDICKKKGVTFWFKKRGPGGRQISRETALMINSAYDPAGPEYVFTDEEESSDGDFDAVPDPAARGRHRLQVLALLAHRRQRVIEERGELCGVAGEAGEW